MNTVQLLNKISKIGTDMLPAEKYTLAEQIENPDAIMVRSTVMHEMTFGDNLKAIARAGAGVNNIPVDECAKQGIVVFNTPGANANGVKELTIAALLLASRDIISGVNWTKTLVGQEDVAKKVEKGKSAFAGIEIVGKTLGVIGLGAIGRMVANTAEELGMNVIGYDPYLTVDAAWNLSRAVHKAASYDEIFANSDFITVHVPATKETMGMLCAENFAKMKDGVRILNLSRADLLNAADLKQAIADKKVACYVTDFPTEETIDTEGIITIPHLGASTEEAEDNCAKMAALELADYLENGNIVNSVNMPTVVMARGGDARICVIHQNIPNMLSQISTVISSNGNNIENLQSVAKKDYAYAVLDVTGEIPATEIEKIKAIQGVIRVRVIK